MGHRGPCCDLQQSVFCLCFPLGVLKFLVLNLDLECILSLFLCMMLESVLVHSFTRGWPVFPASLVKENIFSPLYTFTSFVKDKMSIGACIYLWAFYFVPLIYVSLFLPIPYCLDDCSFVVYSLKSGRLFPPVPFFFLKIALAIWDFSYFHTTCEIICSSSLKNTVGSLIGIALNL